MEVIHKSSTLWTYQLQMGLTGLYMHKQAYYFPKLLLAFDISTSAADKLCQSWFTQPYILANQSLIIFTQDSLTLSS